ncbi:MAG: Ig-like domain-containing protein [candidate division WOR-3 bacterium]
MKIKLTLVVLGILACAQKMLPPSPDRFPPKLVEVEVRNRTKINVKFNEDIDPENIIKDSFLIIALNETLTIKEISVGRKSNVITLITEKQNPVQYSLQAIVADLAGNWAKIRTRFYGSIVKDTIPPRIAEILPKIGATKLKKNIRINIRFSEEIDTLFPAKWILLPKTLANRFTSQWQSDYKNLSLTMSDSLGSDTIVYFVLTRQIFDFEGNRLLAAGFTFFTSDSVLNTKLVTGKVTTGNRPVTDCFILFAKTTDTNQTVAIIPTDTLGTFSIQIREGIYNVIAIADTNFDHRIDLSNKIANFNTSAETLLIEVYSDTLKQNLDWYLR